MDVVENLVKRLKAHEPRNIAEDLPEAAVLVPIVVYDSGPEILLTQRAMHMRTHKGQVAFPGGKQEEADNNLIETALRECHEEVGIRPEQVEVVGPLSQLISLHGLKVSPYVGLVEPSVKLVANPEELDRIFTIPFDMLLHAEPKQWHDLTYKDRRLMVPSYAYHDGEVDYEIWGLSSMVLVELANVTLDAQIEMFPK